MTHNVTFYIKKPSKAHTLSDLILSLLPKSIYIHCNDAKHAEAISQILWQYPKDRFIPNVIEKTCPKAVILIGYKTPPTDRDYIINASNETLPTCHIEWVIGTKDAECLKLARLRYKHWQASTDVICHQD